jgi:hypothetical protein
VYNLAENNLPKNLCVELINFACFLQNKGPSKALVQITPLDVFFGNKPNLVDLKVFGAKTYIHIPNIKREKLEKMSKPNIFLGFNELINEYICYLPQFKKVY